MNVGRNVQLGARENSEHLISRSVFFAAIRKNRYSELPKPLAGERFAALMKGDRFKMQDSI